MSYARNYPSQGSSFQDDHRFGRNYLSYHNNDRNNNNRDKNWSGNTNNNQVRNYRHDFSGQFLEHVNPYQYSQPSGAPALKRRKFSADPLGDTGRLNMHYAAAPSSNSSVPVPPLRLDAERSTSNTGKRDRSKLEEDEPVFLSRYEIERCSPSRKDGIDAIRETHLRYSYCAFIQNLGMRLDLPQTTIGTAMVLCHRFFVRRSHACHDRFVSSKTCAANILFKRSSFCCGVGE